MNLRLFPKHTGVWEGTYTRISPEGEIIGKWRSKLTIRHFDGNKYHQVNQYFWDDGYEECHDFGICEFNEKGELIFDNPRIDGKAWETNDSVCLVWIYKHRPGSKLFEMIDLIGEDEKHRVRNWRWTMGDEFQGITMIDERKTANQEDIPQSFWDELPSKRTIGGTPRSDR
jgi:hypothetical protein